MKLIEHELRFMCQLLDAGELARAVTTLGRVARTQRALLQSVDLLAPHAHHAVCQLWGGLVDYDQLLQTWRYRHLILVYRIIGTGTPSLKGKHSDLLLRGMQQRFFPKLWDIRDEVFGEWTAAQAAKGHDPGYHG